MSLGAIGLLMPGLCAYAAPNASEGGGSTQEAWRSYRSKSGSNIDTVSFKIHFRVGKADIDPEFSENARVLADLTSFLDKMKEDTTRTIRSMALWGSVSPEGPRRINEQLVVNRASALSRFIRDDLEIGERSDHSSLPSNIREVDEMIAVTKVSKEQAYSAMRHASVSFVIDTDLWTEYRVATLPALEPGAISALAAVPALKRVPLSPPLPRTVIPERGRIHLKTNLLTWPMLISNIGVEAEFGRRWSFALPVYYGALNYFKQTLKFRTTTIQPELRYWFADHDDMSGRWFLGAHMGIGWYNVALDGDYRYQDVGGHTPALGGGIGAGYRLTLPGDKRGRWKMEFSLGAGIYHARYDKFINAHNGPYVERNLHRTFFGIDQAAVTLIYTLPVRY